MQNVRIIYCVFIISACGEKQRNSMSEISQQLPVGVMLTKQLVDL